ncbi:glycosyltransferase family 4 protein [Haloferax sulfurifontis]|nr:glycosyltransferase family 4 protein [Haloferax sulfurifontis]
MTDLATGLQERGLDMSVYTSQPNYHSGENQKQPYSEDYNGVSVRRIRAPQVRQKSLLRRLLNWTVFIIWMTVVLLLETPDKERELIFVSITPLLPIILTATCKIKGWEYTYIAYDLYPDQAVELGYVSRRGIIDRIWTWLTVWSYRGAKNIVSNGPIMTERIMAKSHHSLNAEKISLIHNWADEDFIKPIEKEDNWFSREHGLVDPFTVIYSGNIGEFHDLETVVRVATRFKDKKVKFLIIGEGDDKQNIIELARDLDLGQDTIQFLPYQPWDDIPYSLTAGDVSIVTVRKGFEGVCVSSKLYTSMAVGEPVLTIAQPHDDESILTDMFNAGFHVKQGDLDSIEQAINSWRRDPEFHNEQGRNARVGFEENFTKRHSVDNYYQMLSDS